jgi:hypothetical protein
MSKGQCSAYDRWNISVIIVISLKCYDIPELVAPIGISLLEDAANTKLLKSTVLFGKGEVITPKMVWSPP